LPRLKTLESKYEKQGLVVLGIHSPTGVENLKQFLQQNKITHPVAIEEKSSKNLKRYETTGYPTYTFIARDGKIRYADVLPESLDAAAAVLVKEPSPK
jgi:peroxiredoxin